MESASLSSLLRRALALASRASDLPTIDDETQELIQSSLADFRTVESRILELSLFSSNESLEDISTQDLPYLLVPWVNSEVLGRLRTIGKDERMVTLLQAQNLLHRFLANLDTYGVVPEAERKLLEQSGQTVSNPGKRRELKIKQYQQEKDLRARIETILKRRHISLPQFPTTNFALVASLLPFSTSNSLRDEEGDDAETDSLLRDTTLLLLQLGYTQAHAQLESMDQEVELLKSMPPEPDTARLSDEAELGQRGFQNRGEDMWKLDLPRESSLLDFQGKPLRPFTILPAGSTDRARLQAGVFGPDHNLPTMTIDEYLEIEKARGGIINGGGPQTGLTSSEQLTFDSEQDGTALGEQKAEERRWKDERWARFTDANPKGAGNTMNRG